MISMIKSTGLWPVLGGLDDQDTGLITWYLIANDITAQHENEQLNNIKHETEQYGNKLR